MSDRPILYATKPCGCMGVVLQVDHSSDQAKIAKIKRVAKRRGYQIEWLSVEEYKARSWECPEHKALRVRLAREKAGMSWE